MPRLHPDDLATLGNQLKEELREINTRENVIKEMMVLNLEEVALILQKDPQTTLRHFQKKIIPGFKDGGKWKISQKALNDYINGIKK